MQQPISIESQVVLSAVLVWIIQRMKQSRWFPWIHQETDRLNRWIHRAVAFLAALGILVSAQHTGVGIWTFTVQGLTAHGIFGFALLWLQNHVFMAGVYHGFVKPASP